MRLILKKNWVFFFGIELMKPSRQQKAEQIYLQLNKD